MARRWTWLAGKPVHDPATLSPAGVLGNYDFTYNAAEFTINKRNAAVKPDTRSP
jgi:hypothetical protein